MEGDKYVLDALGRPVPEPDLMTWSAWFDNADLTIERTHVGDAEVVTSFLGRDHATGDGPPILYETAVFNVPHDLEPLRCGTLDQARRDHARMVEQVQSRVRTGQPAQRKRVAPVASPRVLTADEVDAMAREQGHGPTVLSLIKTAQHLAGALKKIADDQGELAGDAARMVTLARQTLAQPAREDSQHY